MAALLVNPKKRTPKRRAVSKSPALVTKTTISKYRRNPAPRAGQLMATAKEGAIGALGAIAAEVVLSKLPIPASLKSGQMQPIVSALAAVGVGYAIAKFAKKPALGKTLAQGGVTVALHQSIRPMVSGPLGLVSGSVGYYGEDFNDMGYAEPVEVFDAEEELGYFTTDY